MAPRNVLPLHVQISEMLIRDIAAGRLLEGERLPPEREMAAGLGISVGTLRKALADLTEKGMLHRLQGSGNYIRSSAEATGVYAFFRLERLEGGGLPTAQVLSVDLMTKPSDLPRFGNSERAHRIRRLRRLSGMPAAVEEIWLDGVWADRLAPEQLSNSLYHTYKTRLGLLITRVEDRVWVGHVPAWAPSDFSLDAGAACGFVERISRGQEGQSVEYSRTWFDADTTRYVARMK